MNKRSVMKAWLSNAYVARTGLLKYSAKRFFQLSAVAILAFVVSNQTANAQSNIDGAVTGKLPGGSKGSLLVESTTTGLKRPASVAADGSFRVASLPPGPYKITFTPVEGTPVSQDVDVSVGSTSQVDLVANDTVKLEKFVVSGASISPICGPA